MATTKELIEEYQKKREAVVNWAPVEAVEKRHGKGMMTARERIDYFFDKGTFTEIGTFVKHRSTNFGMDKVTVPAEGVVTGYGKVNGRFVVAFSEDFMAMAGTFGEYHGLKETRAIEFAKRMGWPLVGMNDSGGARLQEGIDTLEPYAWIFNTQIHASGVIPQIALLMGPCNGRTGLSPHHARFYYPVPRNRLHGHCRPGLCKDTARRRDFPAGPFRLESSRG